MTTLGSTKKRCPNGHEMDPAWEVCPYCPSDRERRPDLARTIKMGEEPPAPEPLSPRRTALIDPKPKMAGVGWLVGMGESNRGQIHTIQEERTTVGASKGAQILLDEPHVSERQASIRFADKKFALTDLDSSNGTYVNGKKIQQRTLQDGDQVRFGSSEWMFKCVVFEQA